MPTAVAALGNTPRRVFLALGRNELRPFEAAPQHFYLVRSVDPVEPPLALPQAEYLTGRGPFDEAAEHELLAWHRIDVIVAKNSGGAATYGKIAAGRRRGLPIIMLRRPPPRAGVVANVEQALAELDHVLASAAARGV
jgi:precorrin-6A/cobalt-precorrin-6A reductase